MKQLKVFSEPVLTIKVFNEKNIMLLSDFKVRGDYDPEAEWLD